MKRLTNLYKLNFKLNLAYIISCLSIVFLTTAVIYIFPMVAANISNGEDNYGFGGFIAPTELTWAQNSGASQGKKILSYSFFIGNIIHSIPMWFLITLFRVLLINFSIVNDVTDKKIYNFLSLPISRSEYYLSKNLFVLSYNFFLNLVTIILTILFVSFSKDAAINFKYVALKSFYFVLFNLFTTALLLLLTYFMLDF